MEIQRAAHPEVMQGSVSEPEASGGASILLCLAGAAEGLSEELPGVADRISVILPWGRLLRSVAQPDLADLRGIAALCSNIPAFQPI